MLADLTHSVERTLREHHMICCYAGIDETAEYVQDHEDAHVFDVVLTRREGKQRIGLELDIVPERQVIPVFGVIRGDLADEWNRRQQDSDMVIKHGDVIVNVNGVFGKTDLMMQAMRDLSEENVSLKLVRIEGEVDDHVYVQCGAVSSKVIHGASDALMDMQTRGMTSESVTAMKKIQSSRSSNRNSISSQTKDLGRAQSVMEEEDEYAQMTSALDEMQVTKDAYWRAGLCDEAKKELLAPWTPVFSKSQERFYYFHPVTEETSWRKPTVSHVEVGSGKRLGTIVGMWTYEHGTFAIQRINDALVYTEEAHGIFGLIEEDNGTLFVVLLTPMNDDERCPEPNKVAANRGHLEGRPLGFMKLESKGDVLVTRFRKSKEVEWGPDQISNSIVRSCKRENHASIVGTWSYHEGTYSVFRRKQDGMLMYEETCYRIFGLLKEDESGWFMGRLATLKMNDEDGKLLPEHVGEIRIQRRGRQAFSQFRATPTDPWEAEVASTKECKSVEGSWKFAEGSFTISFKHGFLTYEDAAHGTFGILTWDSSGWFEADLFIKEIINEQDYSDDQSRVGKIRVQRRGAYLVTNFRKSELSPWDPDILSYG